MQQATQYFATFAVIYIDKVLYNDLDCMKKNLMICVFTMLAAMSITSCSSDEPSYPSVDYTSVSEESLGTFDGKGNFIIANSNPPSNEALFTIISGYGWREASTHEITSTGQYMMHEYWENMVGGAPLSYEFERDAVTSYMYLDWAPADAYYHQQMRYDEVTGKVYFNNTEAFTVLSATADEVRIVKFAGIRGGDNTRIYHYIILNKLTPEQLQNYKDRYTTDYTTLSL